MRRAATMAFDELAVPGRDVEHGVARRHPPLEEVLTQDRPQPGAVVLLGREALLVQALEPARIDHHAPAPSRWSWARTCSTVSRRP